MRFKLIATAVPGHDIEAMCIVFTAPTWAAAAEFVTVLMRQIGYKIGTEIHTEITRA